MKAKRCSSCGVPRAVAGGHEWSSGGAIVCKRNPLYRMIFWEARYISRVVAIMEEMIGLPLERMVIELARKSSREYLTGYIHPLLLKVIDRVALKTFTEKLLGMMKAYGFGDVRLDAIQYRRKDDDFLLVTIKDPYYLASSCGTLLGGVEAVTGFEGTVESEEVSPGEYRVKAYMSRHPLEFKGRLRIHYYPVKPGDIEYALCPSCGSPRELSEYDWDADRGLVKRKVDGVRMALGAFGIYDALISDLEDELGEHIPRLVVESARRFATQDGFPREIVSRKDLLRKQFALYGLGNLREYEVEKGEMRVKQENACLHLIMAGTFQGFFEILTGRRGEVEWDYAEDGDLRITVYA